MEIQFLEMVYCHFLTRPSHFTALLICDKFSENGFVIDTPPLRTTERTKEIAKSWNKILFV
jgi:hypothetical protein